jgi:hypothetical protein
MIAATLLLDNEVDLDAVLPVQFEVIWNRAGHPRPEHALLLAVIAQAATDLRRFRHARGRRDRRLYAEARDWVLSGDRSHPFSFVNVCETLRLSPEFVRAAMLDRRSPVPAAA